MMISRWALYEDSLMDLQFESKEQADAEVARVNDEYKAFIALKNELQSDRTRIS